MPARPSSRTGTSRPGSGSSASGPIRWATSRRGRRSERCAIRQHLATANFAGAADGDMTVNSSNPSVLVATITDGGAVRGGEFPPAIAIRRIFKETDAGRRWLREETADASDPEVEPTN